MADASTINSSQDSDVAWPAFDVAPDAGAGALSTALPVDQTGEGDTSHLAKGSALGFISGMQREGAAMAHRFNLPEMENYLATSSDLSNHASTQHMSQISPETMDQVNASFTSSKAWSPSALGEKLVSSALPFAATIAGAWYLPSEVGINAVIMSSQAAQATADMVGAMSDQELQAKEPYYKQLRDAGVSQYEAKDRFIDEVIVSNHTDLWAGAAGGATGAFFPAGQWSGAGVATSKLLGINANNWIKRGLVSATEAGTAGAGADLGINLAVNQAAGSIGAPQKSPEELAASAAGQFVGQGAMGFGFGAIHHEAKPEEKPPAEKPNVPQITGQVAATAQAPQQESVGGEPVPGMTGELSIKGVGDEGRVPSEQGQDSTQSGGEAKNPRSRRTYPKAGAKPTGSTPSAGENKETGPATPSHPVDDDQKIALDAATIDSSKPLGTDVQSKVGEPQPEVATAQDQQGAPPTGIEPAPVPHPQLGPENAPAGSPAPAIGPETATVPETPQALKAQQDAVVRGDRPFVIYPPGTDALPLQPGLKSTVLKDTSVVHYNPDKVSYQAISGADRAGTLNELGGMGPVTREQAIGRVIASGGREKRCSDHGAGSSWKPDEGGGRH